MPITEATVRYNLSTGWLNLYVALSRSSGLLRDFKDDLFRASHDPALTAGD